MKIKSPFTLLVVVVACLHIGCGKEKEKQDPWQVLTSMAIASGKVIPTRFTTTDWIRVLKHNFKKSYECEDLRRRALENKCITIDEKRDLEHIGAYPECDGSTLTGWSFCGGVCT